MALISLKCNSCGGDIQMDDTKETGYCMYCSNKFFVLDYDKFTHKQAVHGADNCGANWN